MLTIFIQQIVHWTHNTIFAIELIDYRVFSVNKAVSKFLNIVI